MEPTIFANPEIANAVIASPFSQFALAAGLAWASGMRLYAVCFVLGALGYFQVLTLPGNLQVLSNPWALGISGALCAAEFIADKVPGFDSLWDAVHTFIRGPGGAMLAALAVSNGANSELTQVMAAMIGGSLATGAHLTKAGTRALVNHSPEPFSNWTLSAIGDVASLGIVWLAWQHPVIFCVVLAAFIVFMVWAIPKLWRLIRGTFRRLHRFFSGNLNPKSTDPVISASGGSKASLSDAGPGRN